MKNVYKQKRQEGFTIIEVMIVLAIAAVILLIVLLAVPALQRNSRNTQRNNDAAQLAAAINTCLANQNGDTTKCQSVGTNNVDIDLTKFGQLTTNPTYGAGYGTVSKAQWVFQSTCSGNVQNVGGTASLRAFTVTFQSETTGAAINRCVSS